MTAKKKPILRFGAALTLLPIFTGLLLFIWGASYEWATLKAEVGTKAKKSTVVKLHHKIDKILIGLCLMDSKACVLKEEE